MQGKISENTPKKTKKRTCLGTVNKAFKLSNDSKLQKMDGEEVNDSKR